MRIALGAQRYDIFKLIVGHGMVLTLIGLGCGLLAAFVLTRFLSSVLFGVSATDPLTYFSVSLALILVALLACYMSLEEVESFLIQKALARFDGNVGQAAQSLGLSRSALYRRLQRYGL